MKNSKKRIAASVSAFFVANFLLLGVISCGNASSDADERIVPHSDYLVIEEQDGEFVVTGCIEENFPADGKIEIPEGVNRLIDHLFEYNDIFTITFPYETISTPIRSVTIAGSVKELPFCLFFNNYLEEVILNKGIKIIGCTAFEDNKRLESIYMPDGLQVIANCSFQDCRGLKSISIPSSVDRIGIRAFGFDNYSDNDVEVEFRGTKDQWEKIIKSADIFYFPVTVHCKDGDIENFTGGDEAIQVVGDYLPRTWDGKILPGYE